MNGSQNIFASSTNQQINSENIEENASCNICARTFLMNRDLLQHLNFCRRISITNNGNQTLTTNDGNNDNTSNTNYNNGNDISDKIESQEKFYWNLVTEWTFQKDLNNEYEKIAHLKKNLLMLLSGAAGKRYVEEVTRLMKLWVPDALLKSTSLKVAVAKLSLKLKNLMSKGNVFKGYQKRSVA